jgi:hypothetical protein
MTSEIAADKTAVVSCLLEELLTRLDGLLDTGTTAVLAGVVPNSRAFIEARCEVLRSLVVVIRALLPADFVRGVAGVVDRLPTVCEHLAGILGELANDASPPRDASAVVADLRSVVGQIEAAATAIAGRLRVSLSAWNQRQSYREQVYENLTAVLDARASHETGAVCEGQDRP